MVEIRSFRLWWFLKLSLSPQSTLDNKDPQPNTEAAAAAASSFMNIFHFTQKLVEKLYSGMFSADPRHILLFIMEHIMVVRTPGCQWWYGKFCWLTKCLYDMLLAMQFVQTDKLSFLETGYEVDEQKEEDLYGLGNTWWLLSTLQSSHLKPPEIHLSGWELRSHVAALELCLLLDSAHFVWVFYCDCCFNLNCCYSSPTKKGPRRFLSPKDLFHFLL